jgi:hypothetical protein
LGAVLVQSWCNWHGKDGFCALYGQIDIISKERMDIIFPQIQDLLFPRSIRNQKFTLSETEWSRGVLSIELRVRGGKIVLFLEAISQEMHKIQCFSSGYSHALVQENV